MKKFLILFLALTFVFSMAVFAVADDTTTGAALNGSFTISGDMRVRGIWQNNYDFNDTNTAEANNADDRWWEQRLRLKLTGLVGNGIEVRTRLNVGDDSAWGSQDGVQGDSVNVDYAYLHIPVGMFVIDAGTKTRNWGNKFLVWDREFEGVEVTTNVGDVQIGVFTDKTVDRRATSGDGNLSDDDSYGIYAIFNADNMTAGLRVTSEDGNATNNNGKTIDLYFSASMGAITIAGEIAQKRGALYDETDGDHPIGGFLYAATDVGAINVNVFASVIRNGFVADDDLAPSLFLGTAHPTAGWDVQADTDSTTRCVAVGVGTDISSALSVSAKYLWADLENLGTELGGTDSGNEQIDEIDVGLAYKLADNATFYADFGYLIPQGITPSNDHAMTFIQKVQVYF